MPDTPDARAAQALELSYALDIPGVPFQRSAAADLLRALAADVTQAEAKALAAKDEAARIAHMHAQSVLLLTSESRRANAAEAKLAVTVKGLSAVLDLIEESGGVYGLHLNGDPAPWSELRQGGRFDDWLRDFDAALDAVGNGNRPEIPDSSGIDWQPIAGAPKDGTLFLSPQGPTFRQLRPCDADGNCADGGGWVVVLGCPEDGGNGVAHLYVPDGYLTRWAPMPGSNHFADTSKMVYEPYPGAFDGIIGTAAEQPIRDLVSRFAAALLEKLIAAEAKYGWRNGWLRDDWADKCRAEMRRHIEKGDPRDVAAYCAFLWHHGWSTAEALAAFDPTGREAGEFVLEIAKAAAVNNERERRRAARGGSV